MCSSSDGRVKRRPSSQRCDTMTQAVRAVSVGLTWNSFDSLNQTALLEMPDKRWHSHLSTQSSTQSHISPETGKLDKAEYQLRKAEGGYRWSRGRGLAKPPVAGIMLRDRLCCSLCSPQGSCSTY